MCTVQRVLYMQISVSALRSARETGCGCAFYLLGVHASATAGTTRNRDTETYIRAAERASIWRACRIEQPICSVRQIAAAAECWQRLRHGRPSSIMGQRILCINMCAHISTAHSFWYIWVWVYIAQCDRVVRQRYRITFQFICVRLWPHYVRSTSA